VLLKLLLIAFAGALGTLARYGLGGWVHALNHTSFPWGTVAVNLLGCLAFGVVWSVAEGRLNFSSEARTIVLVGFMGGFTTFSSFIFETGQLLRDAEWLFALGNFTLQNIGGLAVLILGMALGRLL
jgi:fluoride exporter